MKMLIVIAPEQFREEELDKPVQKFTEKGIEYVIASTKAGECTGVMGTPQTASIAIADAKEADYDGILIVGGIGSRDYLWNDEDLLKLVKEFNAKEKVIAAICLAPVVLARAHVLSGIKATVFESPASDAMFKQCGADNLKEPVVSDKNIVTANHPIHSADFADAVVKRLGL